MTARVDEDGPLRTRGEVRRTLILDAAIEQFAARGIRATSMAHIAEAAGVSRPAVYQYFQNKDEVFASAFIGLFENLVARAIAALDAPGTTAQRLDGFLQRYEGDLWERTSASPHVDEIIDAKNDKIEAATAQLVSSLSASLGTFLNDVAPVRGNGGRQRNETTVDLLRLGPKGFRYDQPSVAVFRRRLTMLAQAVAADLEGTD
ncbi:MAG: TetR/AcrR family transcriptional regulator [Acidimicrobiales bacterium]